MKINEVEALVGVTRRNIRFYEKAGLLAPARNSQNGYRDYGEIEVEELKRIKLLRKLGVPLDEIRRMQTGSGTVADGIRRHLVALEREQQNLTHAQQLCHQLRQEEVRLSEWDAGQWLVEMDRMEQAGAAFRNIQRGDVKVKRYVPSVIAAAVMVVLMVACAALLVWAYTVEPAPPLVLILVMVAVPVVVILGVLLALFQRWKEIGKGEVDEAKKY